MNDKIKDLRELFYVGMIVKNYQTMCEITGESYQKNAEPKKRQHDNWKRFINWEKSGNKYIITEVKDNPDPEVIRKGKSKYINDFGFILLERLRNNNNELYCFSGQLFEEMRMQSIAYREYCKSKNYNLPEIKIINHEINAIFKRCIKSMVNKNLITFEKVAVKMYADAYTNKTIIEELDEEELATLEKLKCKAIEEYDFKHDYIYIFEKPSTLQQIFARGHADSYYKILNKLIDEKFSEYDRICSKVKISKLADAIYEVNESTVYEDLSKSINTRLRKLAWKKFDIDCEEESYDTMLELIDLNSSINYDEYDFDNPFMIGTDADGTEHVIATHEIWDTDLDIDFTIPEPKQKPGNIIIDNDEINDLNFLYEKYGNDMWDDSDEEYIPDGTTPF